MYLVLDVEIRRLHAGKEYTCMVYVVACEIHRN